MDARLKNELSVKAINSLQNILLDHQRGHISRAQCATGIRGIHDAVVGMVDTETFEMISEAALAYKDARGIEAEFKRVGDNLEGYIRICGRGRVVRVTQASPHYTAEYNDYEADKHAAAAAAALFKTIGK